MIFQTTAMLMRPFFSSVPVLAPALMLSASLLCGSLAEAAEPAAPGGGSQKSGKRSAEGEKKPAVPSQPAAGAGGTTGAEPSKRKPASSSASKGAASKGGTEDERFANARKAAVEDPKIAELREKADLAKTKDASDRAMRAYLRALYGKMRTLEPSLEDRINLTEAAALKAVSKDE
jgi:hypothetical protein